MSNFPIYSKIQLVTVAQYKLFIYSDTLWPFTVTDFLCVTHLVDGVPLLEDDLVPLGARLRRYQLLQVPHGVVLVAFHPHLIRFSPLISDLAGNLKLFTQIFEFESKQDRSYYT